MRQITVVGSCALLRKGLVSLLADIGFESIVEADDIPQLKSRESNDLSPYILIVLRPSERAVDAIRALYPRAKIILIVPFLQLELMTEYFDSGASGYLLEKISPAALRESLNLVIAGEKVFPSELADLFPTIGHSPNSRETCNGFESIKSELSRREIQILQCLTTGQSNKAIARDLEIAEATVKLHVKRILRKAQVLNRTQAALWGIATGLASRSPNKLSA